MVLVVMVGLQALLLRRFDTNGALIGWKVQVGGTRRECGERGAGGRDPAAGGPRHHLKGRCMCVRQVYAFSANSCDGQANPVTCDLADGR